MRKLMVFTIGFTAALACGVYLLQMQYIHWIVFAGIAVFVCILLLRSKISSWKSLSVAIIGCIVAAISLMFFDNGYLASARTYDEKTVTATITVTDYSYETGYGSAFDGEITLEGKSYSVRTYSALTENLCPGDSVIGEFKLRFTGFGSEQGVTYHQGNGIFLLAYESAESKVLQADDIPLRFIPAKMRSMILQIIDKVFPDDTQGFARALLLGDSSQLTFTEDTAFKISGIRHIVAVSGLHVSILFSFVYLLAGKRRLMTALLGIPVLFLFAAIAGFTPSVVRACIMQGLMIIAMLVNKEYDPPTALSFAVLVMFLINPLAITSVSLQLSAGCMVGIFLFSSKISGYLLDEKRLGPAKGKSVKARLLRWFTGSVSVSVSAMITTVPLCAYYFGMVSLIGIVTNLLTLWVVSIIFYGIMLACAVGVVWTVGGQWIAWVISWLMRYVTCVSQFLSDLPYAAIYTCSIYTVFWIIFAYGLLFLFFLIKKKHPTVFIGCICFSLIVTVLASWMEPRLESYRVTALDVGQGQCILLQAKDKNYLVDCGGDNEKIVASDLIQLLYSQGINKLDGVILTHFDKDHTCGTQLLLSEIKTDAIYVTNPDPDTDIDDELQSLFPGEFTFVSKMLELKSNDCNLTIFPAESGKTGNESSLCVLFQAGNCDILITGDRNIIAEKALINNYTIPEVDILVAGHHGSKSSSGLALLAAVKPHSVVISVGEDNAFGHPDEEVIDRLGMFGCKVYRTDLNGTIVFRG